jgi:hypothetical protein
VEKIPNGKIWPNLGNTMAKFCPIQVSHCCNFAQSRQHYVWRTFAQIVVTLRYKEIFAFSETPPDHNEIQPRQRKWTKSTTLSDGVVGSHDGNSSSGYGSDWGSEGRRGTRGGPGGRYTNMSTHNAVRIDQ